MRILVLEDYPPLRRSIVECLTEEGYVVDSTDSGDEGLWFVRNHEYKVVLLDIMVPEVSGLEILKKLRSDQNPVPVIMISGNFFACAPLTCTRTRASISSSENGFTK